METLFSTANVHPRDRFAYWHEVACKTIVGHESRPMDRPRFEATLRGAPLAEIPLVIFENAPMKVCRSRRSIAAAPDDTLLVCHQLAGKVALEQDTRQVLLGAGDVTILDARRPYTGDFVRGSKMLVLKLPRRALESRCGSVLETTAVRLPDEGLGMCLAHHLASLPRYVRSLDRTEQATIGEYTLDLLALVAAKGGPVRKQSRTRSLALANLRATVETLLTRHGLDAHAVATAAGISVRYANDLLAGENQSIARYIQSRRIEQCAKALRDPVQIHRTIGEIAFGWGFSDLTHFGRVFKSRFGMTARDYRQGRLPRR
jgi:AraC family transcriptional regulator, positive regulator of tynA and feaB